MKVIEFLTSVKSTESADMIYPLLDRSDLQMGISLWSNCGCRVELEAEIGDDDLPELWGKSWDCCLNYGVAEELFQAICPRTCFNAEHVLSCLKTMRLIYPDGTINKYAKQFLASKIVAEINGGKKKQTKGN